MTTCKMCGCEVKGSEEYCLSCADYIRKSYGQMEREAAMRAEWDKEMRKDAFNYE